MPTYAIGDIQGCFDDFARLLNDVGFDAGNDRLWLVGDLVNRGPQSLEVLRWAYRHRDSVTAVLGNHDLHLLARWAGVREPKAKDTLGDILQAPDRDELLDWLRRRPFLVRAQQYLMVHAGLLPAWTVDQALHLAGELEAALQGDDYRGVLEALYSGTPEWKDSLEPPRRWCSLANVFTRLRTCTPGGKEQYGYSGPLKDLPPKHIPWFAFPGRCSATHTILCGHWAALGLHVQSGVAALDSACVWGGTLTAMRIEDATIFQTPCRPQ